VTPPFALWFYFNRVGAPLLLGAFLFGHFALHSPAAFPVWIALVFTALVVHRLPMRCPFCAANGRATHSRKFGFYLECDTCGGVRRRSDLSLALVKDTELYPAIEPSLNDVVVDIGNFTVDRTRLRCTPEPPATWSKHGADALMRSPSSDLELELQGGLLFAVTVQLASFKGSLSMRGQALPQFSELREMQVRSILGEPYWRDEGDDAVLLFYERDGAELQLEFAQKSTLSVLVMTAEPLLARPAQRDAYRVTKAWPPA
jgi:hypothetical protein